MPAQVLVIEDDADSLDLLAMVLESAGFTVVCATQTAVARARLERAAFDLVLADFMVEHRDPAESWRRLDELVRLATPCPVGLLTAWAITPEQAAAHGIAFVVPKPCPSVKLLEQIGDALQVPPLSPEQVQRLHDYFAQLAAGDYDAVVAGCTEDVVYHLPNPDPRFAAVVHGRDALRELSRKTFAVFAEPRFVVHEIRSLPSGAVVRYTGSWREGNARKELPGAVQFVLRGAQIAQIGVRIDTTWIKDRTAEPYERTDAPAPGA